MHTPTKLRNATLLAASLTAPFAALAQAEEPSVVLVHGAFADGSAWHKVIPILQEAGVPVRAAQLPLQSIEEDAGVVDRLLALGDGPVVLVGHSYGGNVITEAGDHERVEALVYVAGFALEAGESLNDILEGQPSAPWLAEITTDEGGNLHFSAEGMASYFAQDLPADEAALIAATHGPLNYKTTDEAPSVAAWSLRPTHYVLTENDLIIPPQLQGFFAERMGAEVTTIASSHAAMLSQPEAVADVILQAVRAVSESD